jgi:hypothetical protein
MRFNKMCAGMVVAVLAAGVGMAHADTIESLAALEAGGPVTVGDATYSNFQVLSSTIPDAQLMADISSASGSSSITFTAPKGWTVGTPNGSTQVQFQVDFSTPVTAIGLNFAATADASGEAFVGETATDLVGNTDYSLSVLTDGAGPRADNLTETLPLATGVTSLSVIKSIDIAGTGTAAISSVQNVYFEGGGSTPSSPEPMTLGIVAVGVVGVVMRRRAGK